MGQIAVANVFGHKYKSVAARPSDNAPPLVERLPDKQGYRLGLRNLALGRAVRRRLDIVELSRPSLFRFCNLSKETVNLAVPYVFDAMIVESLEGSYGVRATSYADSRAPYHSTACGKAMLAYLDERTREAIYDASGLKQVTPHTIVKRDRLEAQLSEVRKAGFALDLKENEISIIRVCP